MKSWTMLLVAAFVAVGGGAYGQTSLSPWGSPAAGQPVATLPAPGPGLAPGWEGCDCPAGPCGEAACGPPGRFWAEADYLLWWMRGASLPPLVTPSPPGTGRRRRAGVLGAPVTVVLFGGSQVDSAVRSGGRFTVGAWLDHEQRFGVEAGAFFLESKSAAFQAASAGNPILARPFFDVTTNRPAA